MSITTTETHVSATRRAAQAEQLYYQLDGQRSRQYDHFVAMRLDRYAQVLARRQRKLVNISTIWDQPTIYPLQIASILEYLGELRRLVNATKTFLADLEPTATERLKPWPLMMRLRSTDYHLTEVLLTIAMFGPVCQAICPERIRLHMEIREAFPTLLAAYDDTLAQLTAKACQIQPVEVQEQEAVDGRR